MINEIMSRIDRPRRLIPGLRRGKAAVPPRSGVACPMVGTQERVLELNLESSSSSCSSSALGFRDRKETDVLLLEDEDDDDSSNSRRQLLGCHGQVDHLYAADQRQSRFDSNFFSNQRAMEIIDA